MILTSTGEEHKVEEGEMRFILRVKMAKARGISIRQFDQKPDLFNAFGFCSDALAASE